MVEDTNRHPWIWDLGNHNRRQNLVQMEGGGEMKHTFEPWESKEFDQCCYGAAIHGPFGVTIGHFADNVTYGAAGSYSIAKAEASANAKRAVQCVNACTGIEDPAEAIRKAREALDGFLSLGKRDLSNPKYEGYFTSAKAAIAKLQPKHESRSLRQTGAEKDLKEFPSLAKDGQGV